MKMQENALSNGLLDKLASLSTQSYKNVKYRDFIRHISKLSASAINYMIKWYKT